LERSLKGVTVPYSNLPEAIKEKITANPYEIGISFARGTRRFI